MVYVGALDNLCKILQPTLFSPKCSAERSQTLITSKVYTSTEVYHSGKDVAWQPSRNLKISPAYLKTCVVRGALTVAMVVVWLRGRVTANKSEALPGHWLMLDSFTFLFSGISLEFRVIKGENFVQEI